MDRPEKTVAERVTEFASIRFCCFLLFHKLWSAGWLALINGYAQHWMRDGNFFEISQGRSLVLEELIPFHALMICKDTQGTPVVPEVVIDRLAVASAQRFWGTAKTMLRIGFARLDAKVMEYLYGQDALDNMSELITTQQFKHLASSFWSMGSSLLGESRIQADVFKRIDKLQITPARAWMYKEYVGDLGDVQRVIRSCYSYENEWNGVLWNVNIHLSNPAALRSKGAWPWQKCFTCRRVSTCGDVCLMPHLVQPCLNCRRVGHSEEVCPKEPLCRKCLDPEHSVEQCPERGEITGLPMKKQRKNPRPKRYQYFFYGSVGSSSS